MDQLLKQMESQESGIPQEKLVRLFSDTEQPYNQPVHMHFENSIFNIN